MTDIPEAGAALIQAVEKRDLPAIKNLLTRGADPNAFVQVGHPDAHDPPLENELSWIPLIRTPLMLAAQRGYTEVARLLLEHGADPSLITQARESALDLAVSWGRADIVRLLIESGVEIRPKQNGVGLLKVAAASGFFDVAQILLDYGADPNVIEYRGDNSALTLASSQGHADVARLLLEHGADPDAQSEDSQYTPTPLEEAASNGHTQVVELLLKYDADPNIARDSLPTPLTPLMSAAEGGYVDIVKLLLDHGADPHLKDVNACTALMHAAMHGHTVVIQALLDGGAENPDVTD